MLDGSMHFMKTWDEDIFMRLGANNLKRTANSSI